MKISINEIQRAFDDLICERKSREAIASWALELQFAEDANDLIYEPLSDEKKIWDAIGYLTGVDLLNIDGSYLHSIENFVEFKNKLDL